MVFTGWFVPDGLYRMVCTGWFLPVKEMFAGKNNGFLVPFLSLLSSAIVGGCLVASLVLDTNEGPDVIDLYWVNTMRDSFTCNVRFPGIFLVHYI
jgi:hypothetical protein